MLNLTHWRGALIRQRYLWCVRWCVFLTLSLGSVALSAWVMLSSLIQDLPNQTEELRRLRQSNDALAIDLVADRELVAELVQSIDIQEQHAAQLSSRLARLHPMGDIGSLRLLSIVDDRSKTTIRLQLGDLSQLNQMVSDSVFVVRSIDPDVHAVVAEVELPGD